MKLLARPTSFLQKAKRCIVTSTAARRQVLDQAYALPRWPHRCLTIERAESEDLKLVQNFFRANFSRQEPLSVNIGLQFEDVEPIFYGPIVKQALDQGYSMLAFEGDQLVGVSTVTVNPLEDNYIVDLEKREFGEEIDAFEKESGLPRRACILYALLMQMENISAKLLPAGERTLLRAEAGSIALDYRGCDIRRKLGIESAKLAAADGYNYIDSMCSAAASTKLTFDCVFRLPYAELLDHGKRIFPRAMHDGNPSFNVMHGVLSHIAQQEAPKKETLVKFA